MGMVTEAHGASAAEVAYMLYTPSAGGYVKVPESEIASLDGELRGYALNMGDTALIYVHPLSVVLLIKEDPGEFATLAGMILVMLGAIFMCLLRGKKGNHGDFETSSAKSAPAEKSASSKKSASRTPTKGGKR